MCGCGVSKPGHVRAAFGLSVLLLLGACAPPETPDSVTVLDTPALPGAGQAHLAGGSGAPVILSWQEPRPEGVTALRMARFERSRWTEPQTVATGEGWFINWADFPSVVSLDATVLIAHWLPLKPDERYAYDIAYALSSDGGSSWSPARVLNADTAIAEHGFVSFFDWDGDIGAIWLDGRAVAALTIDELFELEEPVGMTLRYARMDHDGEVLERGEIDELVCDCCQTDAVTTAAGPVIVYRDRTTDEIRDITVRRAEPAGAVTTPRWSAPVTLGPDGWQIDGCPVNGPAISAAGEHVGVAWFTAADNRPRLRFARSLDGGRNFEAASTLSAENVLGQADIVMTADGIGWVSAWHRTDSGMALIVHRVGMAAQEIDSRIVAQSDQPLPTDVPQMVLAEDRLVLAWSEIGDPGQLYSATLPLW